MAPERVRRYVDRPHDRARHRARTPSRPRPPARSCFFNWTVDAGPRPGRDVGGGRGAGVRDPARSSFGGRPRRTTVASRRARARWRWSPPPSAGANVEAEAINERREPADRRAARAASRATRSGSSSTRRPPPAARTRPGSSSPRPMSTPPSPPFARSWRRRAARSSRRPMAASLRSDGARRADDHRRRRSRRGARRGAGRDQREPRATAWSPIRPRCGNVPWTARHRPQRPAFGPPSPGRRGPRLDRSRSRSMGTAASWRSAPGRSCDVHGDGRPRPGHDRTPTRPGPHSPTSAMPTVDAVARLDRHRPEHRVAHRASRWTGVEAVGGAIGVVRRIIGLDHGSRRIGVAIGDTETGMAFARQAIKRRNLDHDLALIGELCAGEEVARIVVGLPLNMDGSEGEQAAAARSFGERARAHRSRGRLCRRTAHHLGGGGTLAETGRRRIAGRASWTRRRRG